MAEFTERVGCGADGWAATEQEIVQFARLGQAEENARKAKQTTVLLLLKAAQERRGHIQTPKLALGYA